MLNSPTTLNLAEGAVFTGALATFTDTNANQLASNFAATINWGDTTTTAGTISVFSNTFHLSSGHTYVSPGNFLVSVGIDDAGGSALRFQTEALGAVPEPGSLAMVVIGLGSVAMSRRRRR